ncbi:MAG TPA: hypothetical protein VF559_11115 [Caulobacteraceae bacterium]|jgi:flavin-dependent dehydrogenase
MLVGDAAGMVSPLTGGGIHPALALGRRAGQSIADHLAAAGPAPELAVRAELPNWTAKLALRSLLDLAPPNWMFEAALSAGPLAVFARRVFFGRGRGEEGGDARKSRVMTKTRSGADPVVEL